MKKIGITIGDPNGIGPEIAIKAAGMKSLKKLCQIILIGEINVLEDTARKLNIRRRFVEWSDYKGVGIPVFHCVQEKAAKITPGKPSILGGQASISYVCLGGMLAQQKKIDALVTCPISKEYIIESGISDFTGHTEYLAELTNTEDFTLSYWHKDFRVAHVSSHVSLKDAIMLCKKDRIVMVAKLLNDAIKGTGIKKPRIGISGLNPHAGEAGAYGTEDIKEIMPAVKKLAKLKISAEGPVPPDIVFARMKGGIYDGVVAMYHDQGSIATKTLFFTLGGKGKTKVGGVNVTLGLPIIRTSVDHGTSFDIAGKGIADSRSLAEAVELAVKLAKGRKRKTKTR